MRELRISDIQNFRGFTKQDKKVFKKALKEGKSLVEAFEKRHLDINAFLDCLETTNTTSS
jgi:hypothetical protein